MDITPLIPPGKKVITGYGGGAFKINDITFENSVIINGDSITSWNVSEENISLESLSKFLEDSNNIEILIIGCGLKHQPLPVDISQAFRAKNISVEIMATGAACRTYNVLLGEGRQVAAALVAI